MNEQLISNFFSGHSTDSFKLFGAHFVNDNDNDGVVFRVYAPNAKEIQVVGDFNNWDGSQHYMYRHDNGIWELFIPGLKDYDCYKYRVHGADNNWLDKADPYAFFSEYRPRTGSKVFNLEGFPWMDGDWMNKRNKNTDAPMSIYEFHFGSWQKDGERSFSYEEMVEKIIPYVKERGFTHIEILPIIEHPFDGSWGYLCSGYFNVTSRYGNPKQLMHFIDRCHQNNIGVIMDFVPVHFVKDDFGLHMFDGAPLYEYSDMRNRYSEWGSVNFDLGKEEVRSFLISSAAFWIEYFHFDGIRVDAVSNVIYWGGNSNRGVNYGAVDFIKRLNHNISKKYPNVMMIAEDSSSYQGVTKPTFEGGLGFDYKWDLGWMNDTLKYYGLDPIYRKFHHHQLTFSMHYFFSEKFIMPLSHDEVVHGKGSIINKMWGNYEDKFAQARNLMTYMFAHPGKKLNFMGNEIAQFDEWSEQRQLNWNLYDYPKHSGFSRLVRDLNEVYKYHPALHEQEYEGKSFSWLIADNVNESIYIFKRQVGESLIICVFNMTPVYYDYYEIGVPQKGEYKEIINTDKEVYGGYNSYNGQQIFTMDQWLNGQPYKIGIKIAPFAGIMLAYVPEKKEEIVEEVEVKEEKKAKPASKGKKAKTTKTADTKSAAKKAK